MNTTEMHAYRNAEGRRICDLSADRKTIAIKVKGVTTVITAGPDGTLYIRDTNPNCK